MDDAKTTYSGSALRTLAAAVVDSVKDGIGTTRRAHVRVGLLACTVSLVVMLWDNYRCEEK